MDVTAEGRKFLQELGKRCGYEEKMLVKFDEPTSEKYGKLPSQRSLEEHLKYGVVVIDKPAGPTSHEVVAWAKRLLGVSKAGHGGTLDPRVTGVLPVALERMTKVVGLVMHSEKEYVCLMQLHKPIAFEELKRAVGEFVGEIYQRPPLRSNVKRAVRRRRIHEIEIIEQEERLVLMRVVSDAGTYMRKLCWDIGLLLGTGAHMRELRRTRSGPFDERDLVRMHELSEAVYAYRSEGREDLLRKAVLPGERLCCSLPKIALRDTAVESVVNGAKLAAPGVALVSNRVRGGEKVALFTQKGELVAIARALMGAEEILEAERGIVAEPLRVVMEPHLYPRAWRKGEGRWSSSSLR
ncbi:MAG: RNA-guided pseudouridylation complex pseudouridine synthase subunit Cbf5 [Acidilobaceae archaeon]|nr:RNA-guided pseudouridylation complex pseudouridine synthase subunit Cbf5 [Acidilobaceae archaeon]